MFKDFIPAFYWPIAITLIDDNASFLETTKTLFFRNQTRAFSDPGAGIQFLNENKINVSLAKEFDCDEEDEAKDYLTFLTVRSLHKKLYKPERFDEMGLLLIDYRMPQGEGLLFIHQLSNKRLKKILLTGVATSDQVFTAFNGGTIDRYVKKMGNDFDIQLLQYVQEMQANYFCEASKFLLEELPELIKMLQTPKVISFFNDFIKNNAIKEFYLLEESGSFLMKAYNGNMSILCLQSKSDHKDIVGDLRLRDDISELDIEPIIQGQQLTTYLFTNSEKSNGNMCRYFFDCKTIAGTDINYAHVMDIEILNLELDRIQ